MTTATVTMRRNDDATLVGAAHALRTLDGVRTVTVDEARSALIVDYDGDSIDDGELLNRVAAEGIADVELIDLDET